MPLAARMRPRNARRIRRPAAFPRPRQAPAADARSRPAQLGHFLRPAGHGKNVAGAGHRHAHPPRLRALNAAASGVKELRAVLDEARDALAADWQRARSCSSTSCTVSTARSRTCCCPTSKRALSRLIGATTHNPFFSLVSPLVSRSQIFEFQTLDHGDVLALLAARARRRRARPGPATTSRPPTRP